MSVTEQILSALTHVRQVHIVLILISGIAAYLSYSKWDASVRLGDAAITETNALGNQLLMLTQAKPIEIFTSIDKGFYDHSQLTLLGQFDSFYRIDVSWDFLSDMAPLVGRANIVKIASASSRLDSIRSSMDSAAWVFEVPDSIWPSLKRSRFAENGHHQSPSDFHEIRLEKMVRWPADQQDSGQMAITRIERSTRTFVNPRRTTTGAEPQPVEVQTSMPVDTILFNFKVSLDTVRLKFSAAYPVICAFQPSLMDCSIFEVPQRIDSAKRSRLHDQKFTLVGIDVQGEDFAIVVFSLVLLIPFYLLSQLVVLNRFVQDNYLVSAPLLSPWPGASNGKFAIIITCVLFLIPPLASFFAYWSFAGTLSHSLLRLGILMIPTGSCILFATKVRKALGAPNNAHSVKPSEIQEK